MHVVRAEYSQFYLRGDGEPPEVEAGGLAASDEAGSVVFTAFRQQGDISIDVEVVDQRPPDLGPEWLDVVETGFIARETSTLTGWGEAGGDDLDLGLAPGRGYRLRYAVADADRARSDDDPPYPERYLIRLWPSDDVQHEVIRSESGAGQYWTFQRDAEHARARVAAVPTGRKTQAIIRIALREHPETARRIRAGEEHLRSGILAYTQKIYPAEMGHDEIVALIDELANAPLDALAEDDPELRVPELVDGRRELSPAERVRLGDWLRMIAMVRTDLPGEFSQDPEGVRARMVESALLNLVSSEPSASHGRDVRSARAEVADAVTAMVETQLISQWRDETTS